MFYQYVPLKSNITIDDTKTVFLYFLFVQIYLRQLTYFDRVICYINIILVLYTDNGFNNALKSIIESGNTLKNFMSLANARCNLAFIKSVHTGFNERTFRIVKYSS